MFCVLDGKLKRYINSFAAVKLIGKLQDGTVFIKKGYGDEQPFEFKIDEGEFNNHINLLNHKSLFAYIATY